MTRRALLICIAMCLGACGDSKPESATDVFAMWSNAGLDVSDHAALEQHALGEADCARAVVSGIETTVCSYGDVDDAKAAQPAGLELVGAVTGASLTRGKLLLVVADRTNADPNGKTIHKVTKTFLGH